MKCLYLSNKNKNELIKNPKVTIAILQWKRIWELDYRNRLTILTDFKAWLHF